MDLDGATVLVTGTSRGIGRALAERLTEHPVRLLAGVRDLDTHRPLATGAAREVRPVELDLSSRASIERGLAALGDEVGRIDVLINDAGGFAGGLLEEQHLDDIYEMFQVSAVAPIHLTKAVLPSMLARGTGKIVSISSVVAYLHAPGITTYSAAKSALSGFAECLRRELAETPVTTLHAVTGAVDTDMLDRAKEDMEGRIDTSHWDQYEPEEWAQKVVGAICDDKEVLGPGGRSALGKLASHLPPFVLDTFMSRAFDRERESRS
jgi:short-subunit dehydrogenase